MMMKTTKLQVLSEVSIALLSFTFFVVRGYKPTAFSIIKMRYMDRGWVLYGLFRFERDDTENVHCFFARSMVCLSGVVDLHKEYWENVAAYAIDKIKKGLTPNPDSDV